MTSIRPVPSGDPSPEGTEAGRLAEALKLTARGDQQAFSFLYDTTSGRVFGLALRVVRSRQQAEEVTQEVFLDIWKQASRFDPERGSVIAWVLMIAHRRSVDRVRSAEAAVRRDEKYHHETQEIEHDSTHEAVQSAMEARRVQRALESLTPTQREALNLAYFGGYTHTEVAAMLDIPLGTAKTRIRDGLIRLRDTLGVDQ